ncbi:MAG: N-acetylmuramic acid 6-phosphate etherase [Candidatus Riflebacteria bacterium]|nr:N-acetylmuramic acid 6-phosphate etherase [Candidatus Riflebacteria bacterium]
MSDKENLQALTETRNPRTLYIDRVSTRDAVKSFIQEDLAVHRAVEACQDSIAVASDYAYASLAKGGRLVYIGAGTSGRLGVLDASECPPTFGVPSDMVIGIIAGGDKALRDAIEGAEDDKSGGKKDLEKINFSQNDTLVGITASGTTPYVVGALEFAKSLGAKTVLLCCNPYGDLFKADVLINVAVGPEVIAGSTRLKSGTACKMVLNMISSISMIKLGKVYENLMVDVKATNNKLKKRALKIVMEAGRIPNYEAEAKLIDAQGNLKVAIIMARLDVDAEKAKSILANANGYLYKALGETGYI